MALITLTIDGELSIQHGFTFEELRRAPQQVTDAAALFARRDVKAVPLAGLIAPLGIKPWARFALVRGADGFVANIPVANIRECVLIYGIGDMPLSFELGGPVRLFARGRERCAHVKAVTSISLSAEAAPRPRVCAHEHARHQIAVVPRR